MSHLHVPFPRLLVSAPGVSQAASSPERIAAILSYHVIPGDYANRTNSNNVTLNTGINPNVTVARTLLNDTDYVDLEGGKAQVLVWTRNETSETRFFLNQK
jgi:hypothetical protein